MIADNIQTVEVRKLNPVESNLSAEEQKQWDDYQQQLNKAPQDETVEKNDQVSIPKRKRRSLWQTVTNQPESSPVAEMLIDGNQKSKEELEHIESLLQKENLDAMQAVIALEKRKKEQGIRTISEQENDEIHRAEARLLQKHLELEKKLEKDNAEVREKLKRDLYVALEDMSTEEIAKVKEKIAILEDKHHAVEHRISVSNRHLRQSLVSGNPEELKIMLQILQNGNKNSLESFIDIYNDPHYQNQKCLCSIL